MSCCPSTAWGELKNEDYKEKGTVTKVDDLELYHVGSGSKCIIWNYDVFGFKGGRTRQMADFMAEQGYMVIVPDYYRGKMIDPATNPMELLVQFLKDETKWDSCLKLDWETKIRPFAVKNGALCFGAIGTCWGSYMVLRLCADVSFKAGLSMHPSHSAISGALGEDEKELISNVKCAQMFMPAADDHDNTKPNGLAKSILGDALEIVQFPDMKHGWSVRGKLQDPTVERDVLKTFNLAVGFFKKYL